VIETVVANTFQESLTESPGTRHLASSGLVFSFAGFSPGFAQLLDRVALVGNA